MTTRHEVLTRVEGCGEVQLQISAGRIADVRVALLDFRRGFETLACGRHFSEVPQLVSRVCAICSATHTVAAARALEHALDVTVPPAAEALRELLLLGTRIESHALHLFLLVFPDLHGCGSVAELPADERQRLESGLRLREFGRRLQAVAGGRATHPPNVVVGGIVAWPAAEALAGLQEETADWLQLWPVLAEPFLDLHHYPSSQPISTCSLVTSGNTAHLGGLDYPLGAYRSFLPGAEVDYSHALQYGLTGAPLLVGAWARERQNGGAVSLDGGAFANCVGQARELGAALQAAADWFALSYDTTELAVACPPRSGDGVAAVEAPRGTLLHAYRVSAAGKVTAAEMITPTAINQQAMEDQLRADLGGKPADDQAAVRAAQIVRAFDPCISCAVHLAEV